MNRMEDLKKSLERTMKTANDIFNIPEVKVEKLEFAISILDDKISFSHIDVFLEDKHECVLYTGFKKLERLAWSSLFEDFSIYTRPSEDDGDDYTFLDCFEKDNCFTFYLETEIKGVDSYIHFGFNKQEKFYMISSDLSKDYIGIFTENDIDVINYLLKSFGGNELFKEETTIDYNAIKKDIRKIGESCWIQEDGELFSLIKNSYLGEKNDYLYISLNKSTRPTGLYTYFSGYRFNWNAPSSSNFSDMYLPFTYLLRDYTFSKGLLNIENDSSGLGNIGVREMKKGIDEKLEHALVKELLGEELYAKCLKNRIYPVIQINLDSEYNEAINYYELKNSGILLLNQLNEIVCEYYMEDGERYGEDLKNRYNKFIYKIL